MLIDLSLFLITFPCQFGLASISFDPNCIGHPTMTRMYIISRPLMTSTTIKLKPTSCKLPLHKCTAYPTQPLLATSLHKALNWRSTQTLCGSLLASLTSWLSTLAIITVCLAQLEKEVADHCTSYSHIDCYQISTFCNLMLLTHETLSVLVSEVQNWASVFAYCRH